MLVMISPVPFLFSLSLFLSFSRPPLFFLEIGLFYPFPSPSPSSLWVAGEGARGGRRGVVWMPGFCRGWGEVGEVAILKKEILCGSRCPRVRGRGARRARAVTWRLGVLG